MLVEDLNEFIKQINRIMTKYSLTNNDQVYSRIVEFVNNTFGVISNIDRENIE